MIVVVSAAAYECPTNSGGDATPRSLEACDDQRAHGVMSRRRRLPARGGGCTVRRCCVRSRPALRETEVGAHCVFSRFFVWGPHACPKNLPRAWRCAFHTARLRDCDDRPDSVEIAFARSVPAASASRLPIMSAATLPAVAALAPPRKHKNLFLLLATIAFGLASHALIHRYASNLGDAGLLLRGPMGRPSTAAVGGTASMGVTAGGGRLVTAHARPGSCDKLSILVIHEHHLKSIGSDLRLLGIILQLRSLGHTVSLLFRGKTPPEQRSPPTHELAAIIGAAVAEEMSLSLEESLPAPPAIYEYSDLEALPSFARQGWFDVVFCPLWFWRDPMASAAELLLPTLALHAPITRRPFVAILSDDAHTAKATMMAEWESTEERKALWQGKARTLPARQRAVYSLADAVVHISASDAQLERADFNDTCRSWHVVRMSPRGVRNFAAAGGDAATATTAATDGAAAAAAAAAATAVTLATRALRLPRASTCALASSATASPQQTTSPSNGSCKRCGRHCAPSSRRRGCASSATRPTIGRPGGGGRATTRRAHRRRRPSAAGGRGARRTRARRPRAASTSSGLSPTRR